MLKLRWFLVGIVFTAFTADYIHMKATWKEMDSVALKATATATRVQADNTACLVELAYNRSLLESEEAKKKLTTLAQISVLQMIDQARTGDPEAVSHLKDLGFVIAKPTNRLVASVTYERGHGVGGL